MDLIGYIRVSTEDQASAGHSLQVQAERLKAWCITHGHRLVRIVVDGEGEGESFRGVSGGLPLAKRQGGALLLKHLADGDAQGVVVASLTRIFRDVDDGRYFLRKAWRKARVHLFSLAETVDVTTAAGRFQLTILLAAGEYERELTAERTAQVAQSLRRAGRVYGDVPFGCVAADGLLYRDPAKWASRCQVVALFDGGNNYRQIADALRRERIPAPNGGARWPKSSIKRVVDTHESLAHLPVADQRAPSRLPGSETAVSHGGATDGRL